MQRDADRSLSRCVSAALVALALVASSSRAVTTQFLKVGTRADFEAGTRENVVATPAGTLRLARDLQTIVEDDGGSASIDAIVEATDGTIYCGTAAAGRLIAVKDGKPKTLATFGEGASVSALALDAGGDLLIGVSGEQAELQILRRGAAKPERLCTLEDAQYVWGLAVTPAGEVIVATGPTGKLFAVDRKAGAARVLFDSDEENLRCVALQNDAIYVGTDPNGLVLKVDRASGKAFVVHDAAETEVSSLLIDDRTGQLYVGTSQLVEKAPDAAMQAEATPEEPSTGRPATGEPSAATLPLEPGGQPPKPPADEPRPGELRDDAPAEPGDAQQQPPTSRPAPGNRVLAPSGPRPMQAKSGEEAANGNAVYRIDSQGFVSEIFRGPAMVFALARGGDSLYVATGPEGTLYEIELTGEEHAPVAVARDEALTSVAVARDGSLLIGAGNAAELLRLSADVAKAGTFTSGVLDAEQVAAFGKLQVRGAVPDGTTMTVSARSSNVSDGDSPLWSEWSEPVPAARFATVPVPAARYAQLRVELTGDGKSGGPTLNELELAYQRPNVAPRIESVTVTTPTPADADEPAQPSRQIEWQAADANGDAMRFNVLVRPSGAGNQPWVTIARDQAETSYVWDTRRVNDGRYDVKVEASDALANPAGSGKTASRLADPVDVDNTPPTIGDVEQKRANGTLTVSLRVVDRGGIVSRLEYRLDDAKDWQTAAASDTLDDSPEERYAIALPDPGAATRVLSLRGRDASGNTAYASVTLRPEK